MENNRVKLLYERVVYGSATESEIRELLALLTEPANEHLAAEWLDNVWHSIGSEVSDNTEDLKSILKARIIRKVQYRRRQRVRWQLGSAAALVLGVAMTGYLLMRPASNPPAVYGLNDTLVEEVDPGGDKAMLVLPDGKRVALDQPESETTIRGNGLLVTKTGTGEVTIAASPDNGLQKSSPATAYHTILTPAGGQYRVVLPDGTKVMLNAASSLKFPASFADDNRTVEFSGEGFFDVHRDEKCPFRVITDCGGERQTVQVLGTAFNIYAYPEEEYIATTVEEGRVKVSNLKAGETTVRPGQQVRLSVVKGKEPSLAVKEVDLYSVLAWQKGLFIFNGERLSDMLYRVARWYDVEFIYQDDVGNVRFQGNYLRSKGMLNLLSLLEITGKVKFKLESADLENGKDKKRRVYVSMM